MPARVDAIIEKIKSGNSKVKSRKSAIKIAKDEGLIKQDGDSLVLTEKGRNSGGSNGK